MFLPFFDNLRTAGVPVSLREYMAFPEGMSAGLVTCDVKGFYYFACVAMVKDERNIDKFDRAFAKSFEGFRNRMRGPGSVVKFLWNRACVGPVPVISWFRRDYPCIQIPPATLASVIFSPASLPSGAVASVSLLREQIRIVPPIPRSPDPLCPQPVTPGMKKSR